MPDRALVFAGGPFNRSTLQFVSGADEMDVWCADGGVVHAAECNLTPKVIVGDCDSVPELALNKAVAAGAELRAHPRKKNRSDLELTLSELVDAGYSEVTLLAASGGRTDHALFNWMLVLQQDWPFALTVIDETIAAHLVHSSLAFHASLAPDTTISLFSRESVSGVNTSGLQYPLRDARLMGGSTLGLSNLVDTNESSCISAESSAGITGESTAVHVSVSSGRLLVCVVHEPPLQVLRNPY